MNKTEGIAYLMADGNLDVPCSRYGRNTAECAPIAWAAAEMVAESCGEPVHKRDLDYAMGLVVNDFQDIENLIPDYENVT